MYENRLGDFLGTILDAARFHPFMDHFRFPRLRLAFWRRFRPEKYRRLAVVNLGAGVSVYPGLLNVDVVGKSDLHFNFLNRFPLPAGETRIVYAEHVLEHFHIRHVPHILREVHRILRPHGVLRISVPAVDLAESDAWRRSEALFNHDHRALYERGLLERLLREAGFGEVAHVAERRTQWLDGGFIERVEHRTTGSLVVEARKAA